MRRIRVRLQIGESQSTSVSETTRPGAGLVPFCGPRDGRA